MIFTVIDYTKASYYIYCITCDLLEFYYSRYGFCVPFISQRYLSRYGVPCDKVYEEGIDYVFIQSNKTFNYYELWSSISKAEDIIEEDSNKQCNKKINRMICHYYIPPCGNSTLFVPPTSVCSDACEQLKQTCSYQWRVFQNTVNKQWFDPLTCNDTGKILDPLPYSCSNIGVYNLCKLIAITVLYVPIDKVVMLCKSTIWLIC